MTDIKIVCEGSFLIKATPTKDEAGEFVASLIQIDSQGFAASPRGLGFLVGTLVGWYLDGVERAEPRGSDLRRLALMAEIHRGMSQALSAGEVIPRVKS